MNECDSLLYFTILRKISSQFTFVLLKQNFYQKNSQRYVGRYNTDTATHFRKKNIFNNTQI